MKLPDNLVKEFSSVLLGDRTREHQERSVYATVIDKSDGEFTIQIDGSDVETPATASVNANVGDRVVVMLKNRQAIITGNFTAPANESAADNYIRYIGGGVEIGATDTLGQHQGVYIRVTSSAFQVFSPDGELLLTLNRSLADLLSAIRVDENGVYIFDHSLFTDTLVTLLDRLSISSEDGVKVDGNPALSTMNYMRNGVVTITGWIPGNGHRRINYDVDLEDRYSLRSLSSIHIMRRTASYNSWEDHVSGTLSILEYSLNGKTLSIDIRNSVGNSVQVKLDIAWIAFKDDEWPVSTEEVDIGYF